MLAHSQAIHTFHFLCVEGGEESHLILVECSVSFREVLLFDRFVCATQEMSTQRDINSALADADNVFQDSNERTELEAELADLLRGEGDVSDCPQAAADTITVESGVTVDTSTGAITDGRIGGASDRPILTSTRHEVGSKDELHVERLPAEPKRVAALSATAT